MHLQGVFLSLRLRRRRIPAQPSHLVSLHRLTIILPPASLRLKMPPPSPDHTALPLHQNPTKKQSNGTSLLPFPHLPVLVVIDSSQCCFDTFSVDEITCCSAQTPHLFCFPCAKRYAEGEIGKTKYVLPRMLGDLVRDGTG